MADAQRSRYRTRIFLHIEGMTIEMIEQLEEWLTPEAMPLQMNEEFARPHRGSDYSR